MSAKKFLAKVKKFNAAMKQENRKAALTEIDDLIDNTTLSVGKTMKAFARPTMFLVGAVGEVLEQFAEAAIEAEEIQEKYDHYVEKVFAPRMEAIFSETPVNEIDGDEIH